MLKNVASFLREDIWRVRRQTLSRRQSWVFRPLRIILLALRGFGEDRCQLRASALTFYSLLSIVPVLAMAFGIAKGFGLQQALEATLTERLQGQEEVLQRLIEFANAFLASTQGGVVAGVGVALLFWTVIKVLGNIESSFNDIWGVRKGRALGRKFSDYLSIMLICPVLLMVSSSVTVFISSQVTLLTEKLALLGPLSGLISGLLNLLPYAVLWVLFTFIYMFLPNTRVSLKAGLTAGIVAGTIYQLLQWAYLFFQIGVSKYNAVYGSFAALPLFLVWLQVSWLVVLFGAEVSFAVDNEETYEFEQDCGRASPRFKRLLSLRIAEMCVKEFSSGEGPLRAAEIAQRLEAPIRLVRELLFDLVTAGVLSEVKQDGVAGEWYQPGRDLGGLTIKQVLDALDSRGRDNASMVKDSELKKIRQKVDSIDRQISASSDNVLLREL